MSQNTLYLLQSGFHTTPVMLDKVSRLYSEGDAVVLMGDAVLAIDHPFCQQYGTLFALEHDLELLVQPLPAHLHSLNYATFAELCLAYSRCISLK
ncbi:DsrH/TusB family sulfur relay protein [Acinetobacter indicus]|uniref:DsrH/TusB family sulfur relay protein n=1 Tax=Acinetobacter indicus TaxID=756892 RepID=UPI00209B900C|nr:DsrH/TusB family sulfur relay protein [Acinetobacter indicus]MCO8100949.1 DsrH/TusB family sulfur relay protein [Acinetobacter indicus]MCO8106534.1 DsrH/TusB family sulfur relay protein [Acinetobacter indicus]MCO8112211.1 DsrH/TusB family sulfur relay protein [Acinetobacter indicus]